MNYMRGLRRKDPQRTLFLAVPESAYLAFFVKPDGRDALIDFGINLFAYSDLNQTIVKWLPQQKNET